MKETKNMSLNVNNSSNYYNFVLPSGLGAGPYWTTTNISGGITLVPYVNTITTGTTITMNIPAQMGKSTAFYTPFYWTAVEYVKDAFIDFVLAHKGYNLFLYDNIEKFEKIVPNQFALDFIINQFVQNPSGSKKALIPKEYDFGDYTLKFKPTFDKDSFAFTQEMLEGFLACLKN